MTNGFCQQPIALKVTGKCEQSFVLQCVKMSLDMMQARDNTIQ